VVIAYRAVLEEIQDPNGHYEDQKAAFPQGHVLWITGGTRGIGYYALSILFRNYGIKRLVLTGREILPLVSDGLNTNNEKTLSGRRFVQSKLSKLKALR